jgi:hypothetical protein
MKRIVLIDIYSIGRGNYRCELTELPEPSRESPTCLLVAVYVLEHVVHQYTAPRPLGLKLGSVSLGQYDA